MSLVSIVIPLYNTEKYIEKAIQSIFEQTYTNWELLICDDGSIDKSLEIAWNWGKRDNRIKVLENGKNQGHVYTYNRLFFEAKGGYIMIQDADDWSDRERIAKQVAILEAYPVGFCVTNSVGYMPDGRPGSFPPQETGIIDNSITEHWAPATIMFRREVLQTIPGLNKYFTRLTSMDRYFIMELMDEYKGYYLDEYLYHIQIRTNSDHRSINLNDPFALRKLIITDLYWELKRQRLQTGTDWLKDKNFGALKAYEQKLLDNKRLVSEQIRIMAALQIDYKNYKKAFSLLMQAIRTAPIYFKNYQTLGYLIRSSIKN